MAFQLRPQSSPVKVEIAGEHGALRISDIEDHALAAGNKRGVQVLDESSPHVHFESVVMSLAIQQPECFQTRAGGDADFVSRFATFHQ